MLLTPVWNFSSSGGLNIEHSIPRMPTSQAAPEHETERLMGDSNIININCRRWPYSAKTQVFCLHPFTLFKIWTEEFDHKSSLWCFYIEPWWQSLENETFPSRSFWGNTGAIRWTAAKVKYLRILLGTATREGHLLSTCECDEAPISFAKDKKLKRNTRSTERAPHSWAIASLQSPAKPEAQRSTAQIPKTKSVWTNKALG